jgi:ribosomal protein S18 acetylase RimI-like enzyme
MPEIEIRPSIVPDFPTLIDLEHTYRTSYVWQMDRVLEEGQMRINFREIRLPRPVQVDYPHSPDLMETEWKRSTMLTSVFKGVPVGYIRFEGQQQPGHIWVKDVVVRENLRRQGIGSALLLAAQEWGIQHGFRRSILEIQSKNYAAIRLGLKLGYEFSGYNDHYYTTQDIALFFARYLR